MRRTAPRLIGTLFLSSLLAGLTASALAATNAPKAPAAAPNAVVEGVQMPAWLERDGKTQPLMPGQELHDGDNVRTGARSRVLLKMGEGSVVKLGENGTLKLNNLGMRKDNLFTATLEVAAGAFRFTTDVLAKLRPRQVDVKIATITAGIRGTDLWGKAGADRDLVCLLEGKISVARGNDAPIDMNYANTFYVVPKNAEPLPIASVDPQQLIVWSAETEIASGTGAVKRGGKWKVTLGVTDSEDDALKLYDSVRAGGYPAEIYPIGDSEKRRYQVRISQLPSKAEAQRLADTLKGQFGVTAPGVSG
jgi:sporulation related protein/FecR-like protein